ncbi:unnamed protein product [Coffea canephora]|uniref:DH200=94 genomic scaffold, scaffold_1058 n=1 Tax=Coffea canephora TaxID=49390 RepID=A0A068VHS9_COFCA|nr:unnamed protein product [Coffea canephora]
MILELNILLSFVLNAFLCSVGAQYHGGIFFLDVTFCCDHPFKRNKCYFRMRKVCSIQNSHLPLQCLDILKDNWSPALTISNFLSTLMSIFTNPDSYKSFVPSIAHLYLTDRAKHDKCPENKQTKVRTK